MRCNLALYILNEAVKMSVGEGGKPFRLAWFKKHNNIPNDTFYRHVNSLIALSILTRVSRDRYQLHHLFLYRTAKIIHAIEERDTIRRQLSMFEDDIPF